jgi:y4mF family transcriptional regulator
MQLHIVLYICNTFDAKAYNDNTTTKEKTMKALATFVKEKRNEVNLTQQEFAERAGVALTVIRKIEQGKENLNLEKVNQVLKMFGHTLAPVNTKELLKNETA